MRLGAALAVVPLLLLPTACGSDSSGDSKGGDATSSLPGVTIKGEFGELPELTAKDVKAPKEPISATIDEGDGPEVTEDGSWLVHLSLFSGVDGKKLLSTVDNGVPLTNSQVSINGLVEALTGAPRGSRVALESTAGETISEQGAQQLGAKPEDTVILVADVLSVADPEPLDGPEGDKVDAPAGTPKVVEADQKFTGFDWTGVGKKPSELQVIPLIEGSGPAIEKGRLVTFNYFGEVFKADKPFDESYSREPTPFAVGVGALIPAWDEGLIGVKEGSRVMIIAPPEKAYRDQEQENIPANSTLVFVIDVLGVDGS